MTKILMPSIAFIVARSYPDQIIGCENRLPWSLKTDMRFFRKVTEGHAVVMGRKTYDSIGHPLPNRMNIILSKADGNNSQNITWVKDRESALFWADIYSILNDKRQLIIMGGDAVYNVFMDLVNKIYLTEVFADIKNGDAFFRFKYDKRQWKIVDEQDYSKSEHDEYPFRITILERRIKYVRQRELSDFFTQDPSAARWLNSINFEKQLSLFENIQEEQYELPMAVGSATVS